MLHVKLMFSVKAFRQIARIPFACVLLMPLFTSAPAAAQHPRDYRGIDARTFNPGRGYHGPGHSYPGGSGYPQVQNHLYSPYGLGVLQQQSQSLGSSSATYSNGRMTAGVVRTPAGVMHLSRGMMVPGMAPMPFLANGPAWGNNMGQMIYPPLTIDPVSGQLVPFDPWYASGLPWFGGVNPYYPGSILGPTLLSMNLSMQPFVPSTAAYTLYDPRLLDVVAPAQQFPPAGQQLVPDAPAEPMPNFDAPLLNEFDSGEPKAKVSGLAEKINSLRYQSVGDEAFRKEDYAAAAVAYLSGLELAPDRRSLWIRMALAQIALENFGDAVRHLKTGLMTPADATRAWVTADELYGQRVAERTRTHGVKLWNWLAEKPLSSDRLLLAGTFQKLRGFDSAADELLEMARYDGPEADYVAAVRLMSSSDTGHRAVSEQLGQMRDAATDRDSSKSPGRVTDTEARSKTKTAAQNEGIYLRGKFKRSDASGSPDDSESTAENQSPEVDRQEMIEPQAPPELFIPKL